MRELGLEKEEEKDGDRTALNSAVVKRGCAGRGGGTDGGDISRR